MSEPKLGQTKKSAVESYLRAKREKGQLTDEEIARLDAIGFKWEKRKKKGSVRPELTSCPVIFTNCKIFAPLLD